MSAPLGIFGGTFDPVHFGHLRAASEVREKLGLERFRLLPAGEPPHRSETFANARHRLAMLAIAVSRHPDLVVDAREIERGGASYMVDTLRSIRTEEGDAPLLLCIGQDAANGLDRWHRWQELFQLAHIVIMTRPGSDGRYTGALADAMRERLVSDRQRLFSEPAGHVLLQPVTQLAISSTEIREAVANGESPRFLLPDRVLEYIDRHGLYR